MRRGRARSPRDRRRTAARRARPEDRPGQFPRPSSRRPRRRSSASAPGQSLGVASSAAPSRGAAARAGRRVPLRRAGPRRARDDRVEDGRHRVAAQVSLVDAHRHDDGSVVRAGPRDAQVVDPARESIATLFEHLRAWIVLGDSARLGPRALRSSASPPVQTPRIAISSASPILSIGEHAIDASLSRRRRHSPVKLAGRFSTNAATPSA